MSCPTDDTLGALVEHALDAQEASLVSSHLDTCDACRAVVIAAVRGDASTPAPRFAIGTPSTAAGASPDPHALVGTSLGRYRIDALLGAGGMGSVYRAFDTELEREVAVKVLRPELARAANVLAERLLRESRVMAKISNPSVITVFDVGREGDAVFIAMMLVRGETLGTYLRRTTPRWREIAAIFERAAGGLAAAHEAGIVHRDFKPENVLVGEDGQQVIVTDFGIAMVGALAEAIPKDAAPPGDVKLTATGVAVGTPAYMAPEQLASGAVDRRADVFAFSVSLWEALFGARPFPGKSLDEIRDAMRVPPRAPRSNVPARLVRALERGLAIDPAYRWPDMKPLIAELAAVRSTRRRTIAIAGVAAAGLVGAGIAGALLLAGDDADPCKPALVADTAGLVLDPATQQKLAANVAAWRATHAATCKAGREPAQPLPIAACLDARRVEIEGFIDDARRDGDKVSRLVRVMVDPARCAAPPPGLAFARVPADPAQRAAVTALRYRGFDIESLRDRSQFDLALPQARALADEAKTAWPPAHAEALYLLGTTQAMGGSAKDAIATLREAAALADRTQHGYIAANAWVQLILSAAFDEGDAPRALEYASYADAALDKIGRPPDLEVLFLYHKGSALVEADKTAAAEPLLRRAVELAQQHAPQYLARTTLGLGYFFENQGRYAEAVEAYRRALRELETGGGPNTSAHTFRERLAINLSLLGGHDDEAERIAREAVALADKTVGEDNVDRGVVRSTLAQVLSRRGKRDEALREVREADRIVRKILGDRSERRGELLSLEGNILVELERFSEAAATLARACETIAFGAGEDSGQHAECLLSQSIAVAELGKDKEALALVERGVEALLAIDGEVHPRVASALVQRGITRHLLGRTDDGIADLERAIAAFEKLQLEPGHLAGAKWGLGQALWKRDRARARALIEEAIAAWGQSAETWATSKADAEEFLRTAR